MNKQDYDRFYSKTKVDDSTRCVNWTGTSKGIPKNKRPKFWIDKKWITAYRVLWEHHFGEITSDQHICHACDNPLCVNINHLWLGNNTLNQLDKLAKGRGRYATEMEHGHRKLDLETVKHIRELYSTGEYTTRQLGETYNIDSKTVHALIIGKTWKSVGGPIASVEKGHANCKGSNNPNSKLSDEDIENIIKCKRLGQTNSSLAEEYNVHFSSIQRIKYK